MKNTTAKYAVFVDDGVNEIFNTKEEAKEYAATVRDELRSTGRHDSCYVKKLTKFEMEMIG